MHPAGPRSLTSLRFDALSAASVDANAGLLSNFELYDFLRDPERNKSVAVAARTHSSAKQGNARAHSSQEERRQASAGPAKCCVHPRSIRFCALIVLDSPLTAIPPTKCISSVSQHSALAKQP